MVHGGGIADRHDQRRRFALRRADRAKQVGRGEAGAGLFGTATVAVEIDISSVLLVDNDPAERLLPRNTGGRDVSRFARQESTEPASHHHGAER
jgi:hypothetical protein